MCVKNVLILIGILLLGAVLWMFGRDSSRIFLAPAEILGGPVRVVDARGDRLYYLTSQWEKRLSRFGGPRSSSGTRTVGWLNVDLWALDAATAQPAFRKRLKRDKVNGDTAAMGVEQGVMWARIPELVGIRLADGVIVADSARIEARNPFLAGLMPKPAAAGTFLTHQMQPLKFDAENGLLVRLDDARVVRIDPLTLKATPYAAPAQSYPSYPRDRPDPAKAPAQKAPLSTSTRMAIRTLGSGMDWETMVRGLVIDARGETKGWLGLLAEPELAEAKARHIVSAQMDFSVPRRQRLYHARLEPIEDFFGKRLQFNKPEVLPESPEFLMGGLLTSDSGSWNRSTAMWRRGPDSVFVLSRDRLGDQGRLQLARVAGPAGRPVWSVALPLSDLRAWMPGERLALMLGPDPSALRSPMAEQGENAAMQVISVNLETGTLQTFNPDLHRDWPVDGAAQASSP
jgi:hypothetical protein